MNNVNNFCFILFLLKTKTKKNDLKLKIKSTGKKTTFPILITAARLLSSETNALATLITAEVVYRQCHFVSSLGDEKFV